MKDDNDDEVPTWPMRPGPEPNLIQPSSDVGLEEV